MSVSVTEDYLLGDELMHSHKAGDITNITGGTGITIDGTGSVCSPGSKGFIVIPYNGTITHWYITSDQVGSATIDLKRSSTSIIGAGNKPALASAQRANAVVSGWTSTAITANDELEFNLDSCITCTRLNAIIYITKG